MSIIIKGSCATLWNEGAWEKVWNRVYETPPTFEKIKFFTTYRTSPLFGIFRIRS